eukprot:TRINITY_DN1664_c3_g1_i1.p1 TRINITY_DN1664_c3_g1~~TRINITY_DN1664_c3_g1_i1.p1  ORF type:complete len:743 (+),score=172.83 TRINITY_DN1664_c3_g1_i1:80-2230(+)
MAAKASVSAAVSASAGSTARTVAVKNLPWGLDDDTLWAYFQQFGELVDLNRELKGRCRVVFASKAAARWALGQQHHFLRGNQLHLRPASISEAESKAERAADLGRTLRVSGLGFDTTEHALFKYFSKHIGLVKSVRIELDKYTFLPTGRGAVVLAEQPEEALRACYAAAKQGPHFVRGAAIEVVQHDELAGRSQQSRKPRTEESRRRTLHVRGPGISAKAAASDQALFQAFAGLYGDNVTSAHISRLETGESRGFGFVEFVSEEAAAAACDKAVFLGGRSLQCRPDAEPGTVDPKEEEEKRLKESERTLVVKRIPLDIDDEGLCGCFSQTWAVSSARVLLDSETETSRGIGFIVLASESDLEAALKTPLFLGGRQLEVQKAGGQRSDEDLEAKREAEQARSVMVRALPEETGDEDLYAYFTKNVGAVESAHVALSWDTGASRRLGHVVFAAPESVAVALSRPHSIGGGRVEVRGHGNDGRALCVRSLPYSVDDDSLLRYFAQCVTPRVFSARVILDEETGESRGLGIVVLDTPARAQRALQMMHTIEGEIVTVTLDEGPSGKGQGKGKSKGKFKSKGKGKGWTGEPEEETPVGEADGEDWAEEEEEAVRFKTLGEARAAAAKAEKKAAKLKRKREREEAAWWGYGFDAAWSGSGEGPGVWGAGWGEEWTADSAWSASDDAAWAEATARKKKKKASTKADQEEWGDAEGHPAHAESA